MLDLRAGKTLGVDLDYGPLTPRPAAVERRVGTCHNAGCRARHGQLTNAALATRFGGQEIERPTYRR